MIYMYTRPDCPNCIKAKENYKIANIPYVERSASRLESPGNCIDEDYIDLDALFQASDPSTTLPIVVNADSRSRNPLEET